MRLLIETNECNFCAETDFRIGDGNALRQIFDRMYADGIRYIFEGAKPKESEVK